MKQKLRCTATLVILLMTGAVLPLSAQDNPVTDSTLAARLTTLEQKVINAQPGNEHILVAGLLTLGYANQHMTNRLNGIKTVTNTSSLGDADHYEFSPMFLWRHGSRFLLEFEPSFADNELSVNWADVSYFAAPGLILRAGYLVLPYGTYSKRLAAGWIDKLATDPMGVADMAPADYGVEVEGGLPMGNMKMNYDVALSNGNQLLPDGSLASGNLEDNNQNKTVTARVGFLPFSNSSLELGVSGMFGKVGDADGPYRHANGQSYAFDLNYIKSFTPVLVNIKSQYNIQNISREMYTNPENPNEMYTFNNHTTSGFVQCAVRPTDANGPLKNLEIAGRFTEYNTPDNSAWGANQHSVSVGVDYWLSWRSVIKCTYEDYQGNGTVNNILQADTGNTNTRALFLQFSIQL